MLTCPLIHTYKISTDRKAMSTAVPVRPEVSRCELPFAEDLVGLLPCSDGELRINLAVVDQQRSLGLGSIGL